jgi:hypothetical protein
MCVPAEFIGNKTDEQVLAMVKHLKAQTRKRQAAKQATEAAAAAAVADDSGEIHSLEQPHLLRWVVTKQRCTTNCYNILRNMTVQWTELLPWV